MKTVAFKMKLKPGFEQEYKKRHDEIWPELVALLKGAGISDYYIFLDEETGVLFGVQNVDEGAGVPNIADTPIMRKWWDFMADIMDTNPDNSPIATPLKDVFYMA
jgi:L-rhamnose mutarotase